LSGGHGGLGLPCTAPSHSIQRRLIRGSVVME
jgi:hypothetical protein